MPRFSIVMPTRNRANLLPYAVQSALEQRFGDFEVVLSNNDSSDETAEIPGRFPDERLRYVETGKTLSMPDSWEFALSHARGEFVTVLCDDDALTPRCCERADQELRKHSVELIYWRRYHYNFSDWHEEELRNTLRLGTASGESILEPTEPLLRAWYDECRYHLHSPMLFNGFFRREFLEDIRARAGRFFVPPAPDVGASVMMLAHTREMLLVEDVMALVGAGRQSIGADQNHRGDGGAAEEFAAEFEGDIFTHVPYKENMITTTITDTLLKAKTLLPDELSAYDVNWDRFYVECYHELMLRRKRGVNIARPLRALRELMQREGRSLSAARLGHLRTEVNSVQRVIKKRTREWLTGSSSPNKRLVRGEDAGFSNILDCARKVDQIVADLRNG